MSLSVAGTKYARHMAVSAFSPRAFLLGADLRSAREERDVSIRELAARMQLRAHSLISRWESGVHAPTPDEVRDYALALDLPGGDRERLVEAARRAGEPNLLAVGMPGVPEELGALMEIERAARRIVEVPPAKLIPGLLQIGDYARAIMGDEPGADTRVAMRMARPDVLTRTRGPVEYEVLIGEESLRQPIVEPDVMVAQLKHLQAMTERSNVTMQAIRARTPFHRGMTGPFELLDFDRAISMVHLESDRASSFVANAADVRSYRQLAQELRENERVTMSPEETAELIVKVIEETTI